MKHSWVVDPEHWTGLPDGHTRAVTTNEPDPVTIPDRAAAAVASEPLAALLHRRGADVVVAVRPLSTYHHIAGLTGDPRTGEQEVAS